MELCLQTTHSVSELSRIQYNLKEPQEGKCGCVWFKKPKLTVDSEENEATQIYGTLYIHRKKTEKQEASHVAIPIGKELKAIIDDSRDGVFSKYVVHRMPKQKSNGVAKNNDHITQLTSNYISRAFSKVRDKIGACNDMAVKERPTFHEIRALAAHLYEKQGIDPQERMAHKDAKSTKVYTENHVNWVEVQHAEIAR